MSDPSGASATRSNSPLAMRIGDASCSADPSSGTGRGGTGGTRSGAATAASGGTLVCMSAVGAAASAGSPSAIALAEQGRRVLLVSTDPASNLDEVLATAIGTRPTAIAAVDRLFALNLDPEAAAREYRERIVGPYRGKLPPVYLAQMEEQL